ncbi:hypothetical protein ACEQUB_03084 [Ralstonia syzygii]
MSASILGALRTMHSEVDTTRNARISRNHHALYTVGSVSVRNTSAQNGPNWLT